MPPFGLTELETMVADIYVKGDNFSRGDRNRSMITAGFSDYFNPGNYDETIKNIGGTGPLTSLARMIFTKPQFMKYLEDLLFGKDGAIVFDRERAMKSAWWLFEENKFNKPHIAASVLGNIMKATGCYLIENEKDTEDTDEILAISAEFKERNKARHTKKKKQG